MNHILANIQGTTFQSAIVFCASMRIKTTAQQEFPSTSLAVSVANGSPKLLVASLGRFLGAPVLPPVMRFTVLKWLSIMSTRPHQAARAVC